MPEAEHLAGNELIDPGQALTQQDFQPLNSALLVLDLAPQAADDGFQAVVLTLQLDFADTASAAGPGHGRRLAPNRVGHPALYG